MTTQRAELGFENSDVHRDTCGRGIFLGSLTLNWGGYWSSQAWAALCSNSFSRPPRQSLPLLSLRLLMLSQLPMVLCGFPAPVTHTLHPHLPLCPLDRKAPDHIHTALWMPKPCPPQSCRLLENGLHMTTLSLHE